jgi:hypothetical protein
MRQVSALIAIAIAAIFAMSFSASAEEPTFEAPELELKFNLKEENDGLSPQNKLPGEPEATRTVIAQSDNYVVIEAGRETVAVGSWTSEPVEFDISISITSFDIWWESMESSSNDDCYWTIEINHNDQSVSEDESDCTHGGGEVAKGNHGLSTTIDLIAGDTFGIELSLTSWEDVKVYYDNVTYDSGLNVRATHLLFFGSTWSGTNVNLEFAEAWKTNWDTNLDGDFIMLMGEEGYMADNSLAVVSSGNEYELKGNNSTVINVVSTIIEWKEVTGNGITLMMDYTTFDHMASNNTNGTAKTAIVTVTLVKAQGILGDDGGILGLPGFEMMLAIPAIAFVARRFKN